MATSSNLTTVTAAAAKKALDACEDAEAAWAEMNAALSHGAAGAHATHAIYLNNGGKLSNFAISGKLWDRIMADPVLTIDFWKKGSVEVPGPGAMKISGIRLSKAHLAQIRDAHGWAEPIGETKLRRPTYEHGLPIAKVVLALLEMSHADRKSMKALDVEDMLLAAYKLHTKKPPHSRNRIGIAGGIRAALEGDHRQLK